MPRSLALQGSLRMLWGAAEGNAVEQFLVIMLFIFCSHRLKRGCASPPSIDVDGNWTPNCLGHLELCLHGQSKEAGCSDVQLVKAPCCSSVTFRHMQQPKAANTHLFVQQALKNRPTLARSAPRPWPSQRVYGWVMNSALSLPCSQSPQPGSALLASLFMGPWSTVSVN